jgi:hypothetical protein
MANKTLTKANITFRITEGKEEPFSELDDGSKLTQGAFTMAYQGDIEGEGILAEIKHYKPDGSAAIYGFECFTGRVDGRAGSFVLEHVGKFENGVVKSKRAIVPNSGTGELKGICGQADFQSGPADQFPMTLEYGFEC